MSSRYEWLVGTRYLRSTHRRGFVSFVSLMSVCGLALGVATLIVVLSVMNGFGRELRTRILSVTSDATIMGLHGTISDWQPVQKHVEREPGVRVAVPYVEEQSMLTHGQHITGASVRGILPEEERRATGLAQRLTSGSLEELQPGQYRVILGDALAQALHVRVGDSVVLIAPQGVATPTGVMPRMRRFRVTGLFHSGMYEYDRGLALVSLADAARLFGLAPGEVTGLRLSLDD
ncbi:MAG: ABC transporter permease, partial [Steroidobacteraceae bacterium]